MSTKNGDVELVFPSTEIIQDEYVQRDNKLAIVHIFASEREQNNSDKIKQTLINLNYNIINTNIHPIDTAQGVKKDLNSIESIGSDNASCLLLFFFGRIENQSERGYVLTDRSRERIYIRDVWSKFITTQYLRSKPKIFIFQTTLDVVGVTIDAGIIDKKTSYFDFPFESDLFIVYKHVYDRDNNDFINNLSKKITKYGKRNDIVNLITHCNNEDNQALQISTLTRKFYFEYSPYRSYFYDVHGSNVIKDKIHNIECDIKTVHRSRNIHSSLPSLELDSNVDSKVASKPKERRQSESFRPRLNSKGKRPIWKP